MTSPSGFVLPSAISRRTRSRTCCIRPPGWESRATSSSHVSTWPSSKSASQAKSSSRSLSGSDFTCSAICSTRVVKAALSHRQRLHGNPGTHCGIAAVRRPATISGSRPQDYPRRTASSRVHCIGWFDESALADDCAALRTAISSSPIQFDPLLHVAPTRHAPWQDAHRRTVHGQYQ